MLARLWDPGVLCPEKVLGQSLGSWEGGEPGVPGCPRVSRPFPDHLASLWGSAAKGTAAAVTPINDK